jgi:hypothetical protein
MLVFVVCGCVYVWGFVMCGFRNIMWVCICVGFVMCGCVYVLVFVVCGCVYVWGFVMCEFL